MSDVPDDLTSVGAHKGNPPPPETGQEVRSPQGPDPSTTPVTPSSAQFQIVRDPDRDRIQVRTHSPRAEVSAPDDPLEGLGTYRSADALRKALADTAVPGRTAVFEDSEADEVLTQTDVDPSHAWIGRPRFRTITFLVDDEAATEYVNGLDRPLSDS